MIDAKRKERKSTVLVTLFVVTVSVPTVRTSYVYKYQLVLVRAYNTNFYELSVSPFPKQKQLRYHCAKCNGGSDGTKA